MRPHKGPCIETGTKGRPRKSVNGKLVLVTRVIMDVVDDPESFVLHKCDNPRCINQDHLYIGAQSENIRDAFRELGNEGYKKLSRFNSKYVRIKDAPDGTRRYRKRK